MTIGDDTCYYSYGPLCGPMWSYVVLCDPLCGHVLTHSFHYLSSIFNTTHYREKGHKKFSLSVSLYDDTCYYFR